jgi:hypothetical protein
VDLEKRWKWGWASGQEVTGSDEGPDPAVIDGDILSDFSCQNSVIRPSNSQVSRD